MCADEQQKTPSPGMDQTNAAGVRAQASVQKPNVSLLETTLKLAGLAGAVSAVMGLPAVFLHFKRLGVPTYYIDYQLILSAGILPTIILVALVFYFRGVLQQARRRNESAPFFVAVLIPLALPVLPFLMIGLVAYVLLCLWGLSWLFTLAFRWWDLFTLTNRELLYVAAALGGIGSIVYVFREHLMRLKFVQWFLKLFSNIGLVKGSRVSFHQSRSQIDQLAIGGKTEQTQTQDEKAKEWLPLLPIMWLLIPAMCIGLLFAIKAVLYLWEPLFSEKLQAGTIVWVGIGLGFMYGLMMSSLVWMEFLECDSRRMKNIGLTIALGSLLLAGGFFVTFYSIKIYPVLSQAFGGGRPEPVIVWINIEDLPSIEEMSRRLPGTNVRKEGNVLRVGATLAMRAGKEMILLSSSRTTAQGVAIPMENLKMVAWDTKK